MLNINSMLLFLLINFIIFSGMVSFVNFNKHLLNCLLSLEFMMLGVFCFLVSVLMNTGLELYFSMFFLVLVVCEGSLGLSLLISMVRSHGNDYFSSISLL